ncbi:nipped-B-like protein A isoform X2 [Phalaenopsis equestris]|nr:nipped-B-like protein A isoform X2 [Phalaenopsis equestris]
MKNISSTGHGHLENGAPFSNHIGSNLVHEPLTSADSSKPKIKKKESYSKSLSSGPGPPNLEAMLGTFCEMLEDFCGKAEVLDDIGGEGGSSIPLVDITNLINEITSVSAKKILHLVPPETLVRVINVLDQQIQCGQGFSINENENSSTEVLPIVLHALESTHAVLVIMTQQDMPKQLYKEEIIERIVDFSRYHMMEVMAAYNPFYHTPQEQNENGEFDCDEVEDDDADNGSVGRKRRNVRITNVKKSTVNKVSTLVNSVVQKLCSILDYIKDLLSAVRLSDSCIFQLLKASISTFLVDNIQLLQLKSINLLCGVFASYPEQRDFLLDEILHLFPKLQFSKRSLRAYHLPDVEQKQIQMVTALLIHLAQFGSNLPDAVKTASTMDAILNSSVDAACPSKCRDVAQLVSIALWTKIVERCTNTKAQDLSESKTILENLVTDLLTTLNLPEYPAAAFILQVLCVVLLQNAGLKSKDVSARCIAIDVLGAIAARLKRDSANCRGEMLWILQELPEGEAEACSKLKDSCCICFCGKGVNMNCQVCHRWFHEDCLGVSVQEKLVRDWSCHVCLCKKQLSVLKSYCQPQSKESIKSAKGAAKHSSKESDLVTKFEILQQILLNYLDETGQQDDANLLTRWFYLSLWHKDNPVSPEKVIYLFARLKSTAILGKSEVTLALSRDWAKRICLALGQNLSFSRGFDKIFTHLLASLREGSSILRAKALRAVSSIVEADPEVLYDERVQTAVEGRFCDSAISVREAALELVGRYIASHPEVGLKYFEKVSERIKDTGVSVRKRAIKIIRDLCTSNASFPEATNAFIEMISRITDEESSVQDLVCKTFYELWFEEPSECQTQFVGDGSSIPMEVAMKTEQIVDVIKKMPTNHFLVTIIKRNLALDFLPQSAKSAGINAVSLASVRKRCELICKRLLERILQVEEGNIDEEEVWALPYVLALQSFCLVDPTLCAPATSPAQFVVTLQPYLKNQVNSKSVARLLESIISIIDAILPLLRKPPQSVIEELILDLKYMIIRHSYLTVVHACIKCLCSLSRMSEKGACLVEHLFQIFFRHLCNPNFDNKQGLERSLFCIGVLLRYGNEFMVHSSDQQPHIVQGLKLLKKYLLLEDFGLKVRALQALGYALIAEPEHMLKEDIGKILEGSLASDIDPRIKMQAVQNLYEYLLDAENQLGNDGIAKSRTQSPEYAKNCVPVAAGAGDTNICGGIIQLYWSFILERCMDVIDQVRESALKIVEIVLRQGLVHPMTCVPCLIALENDPLEVNSKLAHQLLMNMNEKYPSFFECRLGDGLQMSFKFIQSIAKNVASNNARGKFDAVAIAHIRQGISRIYRLIRGNRVSRNKFMHSIVRKFESGYGYIPSVSFLLYCTEILATLPFTSPDEPLYLIYDINRVIQIRAGAIEANMKTWSSIGQQTGSIKVPDATNELNEDSEEHNVSNQHVASAMENTSVPTAETVQKFQVDWQDSTALQLLLKLKRHLKIMFALNDARCQAFSLKEHPKAGESLSRQNIAFSASDVSTSLPTNYDDMIQKYKELKAALKEDTMDYATYTSTVKRKRPPTPAPVPNPAPNPASGPGPNPAPDRSPAPTPTPATRSSRRATRNRAARKRDEDDDDDDDDDEDDDEDGYDVSDEEWTGGPRKLDFNGVNGNVGRVTRQRALMCSN